MRTHGLFAACAAVLLGVNAAACLAAPAETAAQYWYDGDTKMPLYRQPQLDAPSNRGAARPGSTRPRAPGDLAPAQTRSPAGKRPDRPALAVYSTGPDLPSARLMVQAPGIVFTVAAGASAERAHTWLAARGLRAEPIAGGTAFKVGGVAGEQALGLANALYESGLVQYAQPNWVMDVSEQE